MGCPCETRTSTCRSFATISSGLYRFLAITVLLDVKDIPQVGPLQWGRITNRATRRAWASPSKQTWFGVANGEMQAETFAHLRLASYRLYKHETSLQMRQVFMAASH